MPALLALILLLIIPKPTYASSSDIVFNEIFPHPETGSKEWIELYNNSSLEVNLSSWKIFDNTMNAEKSNPIIKLADETKIGAKSFLILELSAAKLNNDGDNLTLITNNDSFVSSCEYTGSELDKSHALIPDGIGILLPGKTPTKGYSNGANNPAPPTIPKTGNIILSEFMPYPADNDEWVEIYNLEFFDIDIGGWKIDDIEGGSSPFPIPEGTIIGAKSYRVFSFSSKLNNAGDTVRLINSTGKVLETYTYEKAVEEVSFAKDSSGSWQLTTTPTPLSGNRITQLNPTNESDEGTKNKKKTTSKTEGKSKQSTLSSLKNNSNDSGNIAGATNTKQSNHKLSTLITAVGFSLLISSAAYPFVKKQFLNEHH
ncbi:MAG: hypothetical protein A2172_03055 [Candidatus Woykebacteria bacterium RBG_13_40_15]|uniref:LTD domain-containing protein n=1 Tax=Candidatus Woykebacteria bacterium RBG_13_40_15 TaxID=1802593 RepID=A0A1G1W5J0_9BACT|nr:MAG: hypothetical protein A2172_03055 [Candidatus Woykebacteria bacterium RBG_13_40_15]